MRKNLSAGLLLSTLIIASSQAGLFKLTDFHVTAGILTPGQQAALQGAIEDAVNAKLPSADTQQDYFNGMSNANTISAAGVTTAYGTVFKHFLLGITASGGADLGQKSFTDFGDLTKNPEQYRGFGVQAAIVLGANLGNLFHTTDLGWIDYHRLNLYISGFRLNRTFGKVDADYLGAGFNLQYRLIQERGWGARSVKWTGVDVGTGLLYSKLDVDATVPLDDHYTVSSGGTDYNFDVTNTNALLNAHVKTFSIPFEISTGLRLFYILKFIGGAGVDLDFGSTSGSGHLSNNSTITASGGGTSVQGTGNADFDGDAGPDLVNARIFAGPQIEFGIGSVFFTAQKSLFNNALAVNTGLNFFW